MLRTLGGRLAVLILVALAGTLGVTAGAAGKTINLEIPDLSGPYKVGTKSFKVVDHSRPAGFGQPGRRKLMVQVSYPRAKTNSRCHPAAYLAPKVQKMLLGYIGETNPAHGDTKMCAGGKVRKAKLPLVVFSHAYTADRGVYTSLTADLASRGFMVAAVDHTSDAFAVEFPNGKLVEGAFGSPLDSKPISEGELAKLTAVRTRDVRFSTSHLLKLNRKRHSFLRNRIDPKRIGVFGHSLGGATASRVATVDRRFRSAADVDGSLFGKWPTTAVLKKPYMALVAEGGLGPYLSQDKICPFYGNATGPKFAFQLTGALHLTFSDFQALAPQIAAKDPDWAFKDLYPLIIGKLDPLKSVTSQRRVLARFFRETLKKNPKSARPRVKPPAGITRVTGEQLACTTPAE